VVIDFGDRTSQSVGNLAGGDAVVTHTYLGPGSGFTPNFYTAVATATDVSGEMNSASTTVVVNPRSPITVTITATKGTVENARVPYTFEATVTGATDVVQYVWDFGDGQTATTTSNKIQHFYDVGRGLTDVKVTAKMSDGRSADGQTQINP